MKAPGIVPPLEKLRLSGKERHAAGRLRSHSTDWPQSPGKMELGRLERERLAGDHMDQWGPGCQNQEKMGQRWQT